VIDRRTPGSALHVDAHRSDITSALRATLVASRNADGGWPYYAGKSSRLEPTCAALVGMGAPISDVLAVLESWPRRDGLFTDGAGEINVAFNGLAALTLAPAYDRPVARELAAALVRTKGVVIPPSTINRQNNALQGWAWTTDTFSWVESTATCLLGLKRLARTPRAADVTARMAEAEALLVDRVCRDGGWNHGNANMLGKDLPAYVPTTALALLALHDRPTVATVKRSVAFLHGHRLAETGALALALARIALGVYGADAGDVDAAMAGEWQRSTFLGNLHATAMALCALTGVGSEFEAFRV
jgi:hypothetical protein